METYKISEEKYIMDESLKSAALAVINKYNRSIEKLKKNGQLEDDFPLLSAVFKYPTQKEIPDNIKDKLSNKSVIMKINGIDEIELSNYKVLGSVVAVMVMAEEVMAMVIGILHMLLEV